MTGAVPLKICICTRTVPTKTHKSTGTALFHHTYHTRPYLTTPTITILTSATTIVRQVTKNIDPMHSNDDKRAGRLFTFSKIHAEPPCVGVF